MPIRISGAQTTVPGEILGYVIGDPTRVSNHSVTTSYTDFLNEVTFTTDRRAAIVQAQFYIEKTTSGPEEIIMKLKEDGADVTGSERLFHLFSGPEDSGQVITAQWVVQMTDGQEYSFKIQIKKTGSETCFVRAGETYPPYILQIIGL
jgi:hypothetical protein